MFSSRSAFYVGFSQILVLGLVTHSDHSKIYAFFQVLAIIYEIDREGSSSDLISNHTSLPEIGFDRVFLIK